MTINFNASPYFDDFDENKNFHRILFKPGFAVQARELNQLQSILQTQVSRFGKHIFLEGSVVIPGNILVDNNFNYVKLQPLFNSVDIDVNNFIDRIFQGATTGVRAKVVLVEKATLSDPPTIFVKYLSSGTSKTQSVFASNETITTTDTGPTFNALVASFAATGKCIGFTINEGVFFVKDAFVKTTTQTIILDKYTEFPTLRVGLEVTESLIDSSEDETLLDPAAGTFNFFAPGADRYKINLSLSKRLLTDITSTDVFIELSRFEDGVLISALVNPSYNILASELARRTFDESGDYTVNPFRLSFIEHLKDQDNQNGFLTLAGGGDTSKAIAVVSPGKSYVKGFEVETISNSYLIFNKPRDTANVFNAIIRTPIGNFVEVNNTFGIPNFTSDLIEVGIFNNYTAQAGVSSGTLVGNARIRGIEINSSNVMQSSSLFKLFIFDSEMKDGFTFERDAKQFQHGAVTDGGYSSNVFSADINPVDVALRGTISLTTSSNIVNSVNAALLIDLKIGDHVKFSTDTSNTYRVTVVTSNNIFEVNKVYPLSSVSGVSFSRNESSIEERNREVYIFPFPNNTLKDLSDITMRTRRVNFGTLVSGNIDLTTAVGTTFASLGSTNYYASLVTGSQGGSLFKIESGNFQFIDSPTNRNIRISLGAGSSPNYSLTNQDVLIYSTVIKSNPIAKSKTITSSSVTFTSKNDCQSPVISLGVADVYEISNVKMSANVFGTSFLDNNAIDITDNYELDTGQTPTFYGISQIKLKAGRPLPTGPIGISFEFYAHGAGDYFSVESYPDYEEIPKFVDQGTTFDLRDSLDFRPRISNNNTNFKDAGSSRNEFLDFSNDFQTDFEFFLPRIDKIFLSSFGDISYKKGVSSLTPAEPSTPTDSMPLYVIEHDAYGFNIQDDSTFRSIDQRRFTMKDIGKLETRIKNLEFYTTLSLLELDTAIFSVKDKFGLDRFKNGFVVDNFRTHGVGDVTNPEYNISMKFEDGELRPAYFQTSQKLYEVNDTDGQRANNGYRLIDNTTAILNFTEVEYINVKETSSSITITPYDNYQFAGVLRLNPRGDVFFSQTEKPIVYSNDNGEYDTLIPDSVGEAIYGSIWNSWKQFWYKTDNEDRIEVIDGNVVVTESSVEKNSKKVVLPFIRKTSINFNASKLKPNTRYFAFFDEYNVTEFSRSGNPTANIAGFSLDTTNQGNIITDSTGSVIGTFDFDPIISGLKIPSGTVTFRLTDSPTNSIFKESFADAFFTSNGVLELIEKSKENYTKKPSTEIVIPAPPPAPPPGGGALPQIIIDEFAPVDYTQTEYGASGINFNLRSQISNFPGEYNYSVITFPVVDLTRFNGPSGTLGLGGGRVLLGVSFPHPSFTATITVSRSGFTSTVATISISAATTSAPPIAPPTGDGQDTSISASPTARRTVGFTEHLIAFTHGTNDPTQVSQETVNQTVDKFKQGGITLDNASFITFSPSNFNYGVPESFFTSQNINWNGGSSVGLGITSTGLNFNDYNTATNFFQATGTGGKPAVEIIYEQIASQANGQVAWESVAVPVYQALVGEVTDIVDRSAGNYDSLPAGLRDFWEVGIGNGSFPATSEGVAQAIANFSAASTLGYLGQTSNTAIAAAISSATNGIQGSTIYN